jgi:hypothetical protein
MLQTSRTRRLATAVLDTTVPFQSTMNQWRLDILSMLVYSENKASLGNAPSWLPLMYNGILSFKRSQASSVSDSRFCNCPRLDQTSHNTPLGWPLCHCKRNRSSYGGMKEEDELCWQQTMSYHSSLLCQLCGEDHRCLHSLNLCLHISHTLYLNWLVNNWSISMLISISVETKRP